MVLPTASSSSLWCLTSGVQQTNPVPPRTSRVDYTESSRDHQKSPMMTTRTSMPLFEPRELRGYGRCPRCLRRAGTGQFWCYLHSTVNIPDKTSFSIDSPDRGTEHLAEGKNNCPKSHFCKHSNPITSNVFKHEHYHLRH
jgi:hypothetical protein